jgi:hypothetical protein
MGVTSESVAAHSRQLQRILIKVTERLARELASPSPEIPDWSTLDWSIATAVAAMHGVSSLLSYSLCWQGPEQWMHFLEEQRTHVSRRHARIVTLLQQIDRRAREADIGFMALKGAALHALGLYTAGERPMADVDVLVHPRDAARAVRLIESLEFREYRRSLKERAFAPIERQTAGALGEHSNNDVTIELHERICERLPLQVTDVTEAVLPQRLQPGLNSYPSRAALLTHLLLHTAGDMAMKSLRLIQLNDLALVVRQMTETDWDEFLEWRCNGRGLWWALPPLKLTLRYYALSVPARALSVLESQCPWVLRRNASRLILSDVSFSHLWVDAFPGIKWARSVREALRYAGFRIRPGTEQLAARTASVVSQNWAAGSSWAALPQGRRIARWLIARQVRPVTLHVLRAALARAP